MDVYGESGWMRFLRRLNASRRIGRVGDTEVRFLWIGLLLPLFAALELGRSPRGAFEVVILALLFAFWLYLIVLTHEFGHVVAGRRFGMPTPLVTLSPLGGLAHMSAPAPSPRAEALVSLAGPAVHLLWLGPSWLLYEVVDPWALRPEGWLSSPVGYSVWLVFQMNLWLMLFNLLPVFPLDGGRVLRAFLSTRTHPNRATIIAAKIGMVGAVGIAVWGLFRGGTWSVILIAIGITAFLACRQEIRMARHGAGPYGGGEHLDPWQADADAWKRSGGTVSGYVDPDTSARRAKKAQAAETRKREEAARLAADVDRVLDRVSEVGMAGLTRAERKILERASRERRAPRK